MNRLTERITNQKGAALVEFAIVLPLLLVLVFGMIEFSIMFYDKAVITNASREGARAGIVYDFPDRVTMGQIEDAVKEYASGRLISFGGANLAPDIVSNECLNAGDSLTVSVAYEYTYLVLPSLITTLTGPIDLTAVTTMRCE